MAIYRYADQVSYRDTVLYRYRNIKMSYSTCLMLYFCVFKVGGKHSILVRKVTLLILGIINNQIADVKLNLWVTYSLAFN